ncbi:MAG: flippase-like domain-containing protein [Planctomycetales bacterium]|nr:flippase-like domain-containing protein [Planctomycetales bacterium]
MDIWLQRRWLWPVLKWSLFAIVLTFVIRHGHRLWTDAREQHTGAADVHIHAGWMFASVGLSIVAWSPSVWYWRRLMRSLGENVSWKHAARAYFCGHLGKYVPGKAAVLIIRAAMLKPEGVGTATAAFTVTFETLTYMAAGVMTVAGLLPWWADDTGWTARLPASFSGRAAFAVPTVLVCLVGWAVFSQVFIRFVRRLAKVSDSDAASAPRLSLGVCLSGIGPLVIAWFIHGLSLGCAIQSVSPEPVAWSDWPAWTAANVIANVLGFAAVFAPGGVGVREGLLMNLLSPRIGPLSAVLVAVLMRGVSFVGETVMAAALYYAVKPSKNLSQSSRVTP